MMHLTIGFLKIQARSTTPPHASCCCCFQRGRFWYLLVVLLDRWFQMDRICWRSISLMIVKSIILKFWWKWSAFSSSCEIVKFRLLRLMVCSFSIVGLKQRPFLFWLALQRLLILICWKFSKKHSKNISVSWFWFRRWWWCYEDQLWGCL